MPTDAEITAFLCEKVLGWVATPQSEGVADPSLAWRDSEGWPKRDPDFLTWAGFGLLWEALMKGKKEVVVNGNEFGAIARAGPYTNPGVDPDPKRALMLAAFKAYGGVL